MSRLTDLFAFVSGGHPGVRTIAFDASPRLSAAAPQI